MSENESEKRETLAAIAAELRDEAARADMEQYYTLDDAAESMREYAERIEAIDSADVWRSLYAPPVGNAAAMREALEKIYKLMTSDCPADEVEIANICFKALSEPARNCDRPECATSKAAQDVWRKEDGGGTPYYEWLLAPAAERKGAGE